MTIFLFDRVENNVEQGENAGYQHFLLFPQCFQMLSYLGSLKEEIVHSVLFPQCFLLYLGYKSSF